MTPEQIKQERAAFEAWHKETFGYLPKKYKDGTFMSSSRADEVNPQDMFEGWLARAEQTGWISVEDKLPEADAIVLAVVRNNPEVGLFSLVDFGDDGLRWSIVTIEGVCPVDDLHITHWQPLPRPPEGDEQ